MQTEDGSGRRAPGTKVTARCKAVAIGWHLAPPHHGLWTAGWSSCLPDTYTPEPKRGLCKWAWRIWAPWNRWETHPSVIMCGTEPPSARAVRAVGSQPGRLLPRIPCLDLGSLWGDLMGWAACLAPPWAARKLGACVPPSSSKSLAW